MTRSDIFIAIAIFCLSFGLAATPALAQSSKETGQTQIGQGFYTYEISLGSRSKSVFAFYPQRSAEGTLTLCGGVQIRGAAGGLGPKSREAVAVTVNGKRAVRGVRWFPIISTREELRGTTVPCRTYPAVAVPEGATFGMEIFKRRVSG